MAKFTLEFKKEVSEKYLEDVEVSISPLLRWPDSVCYYTFSKSYLNRLIIQHGSDKKLLEFGVLFLKRLQALNLRRRHTPYTMFAAELTARNPSFCQIVFMLEINQKKI